MAEGVPTNNQRRRRSGPCRLWGGLDKARHIVPTALLVRVQCFRKSLHKAVQGPSTTLESYTGEVVFLKYIQTIHVSQWIKKSRWWQLVSNPRRSRCGLNFESSTLPTELSQRWRRGAYFRFIKCITTRDLHFQCYDRHKKNFDILMKRHETV